MPSSPLIALWRARPFRPVALRLRDGRSILILNPDQLATSSDERRFAVVSSAGVDVFMIEDIDSYEVLVASARHVSYGVPEPEDDVPPPPVSSPAPVPTHASAGSPAPTLKHAPAAPDALRQAGSSSSVALPDAPQPQADPVTAARMHAAGLDYDAMQRAIFDAGEGRLHLVPTDDGLRLTQFTLFDHAGQRLLTTLGSRWHLFGLESFENGRAFHLVHADDPLLIRQVLIWPAVEQAKLDPFGPVMSLIRAREELAAIDAAARQSPRSIPVKPGYFESLVPKPTCTAPNSRWWENPAQPTSLVPDGTVTPLREHGRAAPLVDIAPPCHMLELWPGEPDIPTPFLHPRLVDPAGRAILDLRGSRWGAMIEWDAAPGAPLGDPAPAVILRLINRDERERFGVASLRLAVYLGSCCVRGMGGEGSTSLGRLHLDAHHCVTPDMLLEWLAESLGRGRDLPW